jgi:hypothetical protein
MGSNEWREWHLTPNGWVAGTFKYDGGCKSVPNPDNRVLTCVYSEVMVPGYTAWAGVGEPELNVSEAVSVKWNCPNIELIYTLLEKFGFCPKLLED